MAVLNEDMNVSGARVEDAENRIRWKQMIRSGDPYRETPKVEEDWSHYLNHICYRPIFEVTNYKMQKSYEGVLYLHFRKQLHHFKIIVALLPLLLLMCAMSSCWYLT